MIVFALLSALTIFDSYQVPLGLFRAMPSLIVIAGVAIVSLVTGRRGFAVASGLLVVLLVLFSSLSDHHEGLAHPIGCVALIPVESLILIGSMLRLKPV